MRLQFKMSAPLVADDEIAAVSRIVSTIEDGWHDWAGPDPDQGDLDLYYVQNPTHRELLTKSYVAALAYGQERVRVLSVLLGEDPLDPDEMTLEIAVHFLRQPLEVLVENARNDGTFYLACIQAIDGSLANRFRGMHPAAVFGQGGGKSEVRKLIRHRFETALSTGAPPPRFFLLLDSDSRFPQHLDSDSLELKKVCDEFDVPLTLLQKRSIENYISDAQLLEYATKYPAVRPSVEFLISLTPEQRDHYPIKSGFEMRGDQPIGHSDQERSLYAGVAWPNVARKLPRLAAHVLALPTPIRLDDLQSRNAIDEMNVLAARLNEEI